MEHGNSGLVTSLRELFKRYEGKGGFDLLPALPPPSELSLDSPMENRPILSNYRVSIFAILSTIEKAFRLFPSAMCITLLDEAISWS